MHPTGQLQCPNCNAALPAENINVQAMTAVCPNCDTVFAFEAPPLAPRKQRKVHEPEAFETLIDANGGLTLRYPSVSTRAERIGGYALTATLLAVGLILFGFGFILSELGLNVMGAIIAASGLLAALAMRFSTSTIYLDGAQVLHRVFGSNTTEFDSGDFTHFEADEMPLPYGTTPGTATRYAVYGVRRDGKQRLIVQNIREDFAEYIASALSEHLQTMDAPDASRLQDVAVAAAQEAAQSDDAARAAQQG